ncbi:cleavage and polyadenylation specificity factor subunit 1-like [Dysidea avara]|uniref:cleavage and polyadenylation specificity factor subunit 1-like n=1 Tax=Dysidea avara TaxID=196820 RepID=UPI00331AE0B4
MWTVLTAEQEDSMDLNTLQDISAHAFLILSHKESTMVLQTGQEITELDSSGFITSSPTVFAGNIGEKKYILQVTSSTVQLLQGVEKVHQITVDTSHGAVIACDVVGPYGVLLLQEGVGLLKLHEEQGEQLLEAGMSLRDEQSFMGDDNTKGSILTLEWPTLEQGSRITCVSVYKDTSGIFSLDVVDAEVFYPRRRKSSERTPQIARTPSKSLIDEEDELLYGDASGIQVKKEETRPSVFSHIPSTPVKHSGRSTATYWCALAREDGSMEIYSLPEFNLVYSVRNFSAAPRVLVDSGPIYTHSSSHQVTSSEHRVKELLLTGMGPQYSYPHLLAFIDNDLVIYKAYQYPLSSVQGHLQLRFSKHNHRILLRDKKDSKIAKSSELMDDAEGGKPSPHVPQLRVFRDVAGYCGVFVCGPYPHWLFMTERGALRCHPMSVDGPVVTFSSFHNVNCKKGFLYFNNEGELRIAVLPTYLSYDSHWPVRKVPTKSTAHFVSYHPDAKIHAVITSEDQICQVIPKMNGDETISLDSVEKDDRFVHPTCEKYSLQLYSPTVWEPVPNARHEFDDFEHVVTMKVMNLRSQETIAGRKPFIVIGTLTVHGEEVSSRGKIVIYDVIEVVPEPGKPLTKHKMKLLCSKDQKGPVTALDNIDGLLLTCIGQKIFLWTFRDNKDIVGVAFIDTKLYIHSVACIRNFILVADLHQGAMLMQYREDLKTLSVISKDPFVRNVYSTEYVVDGQQLGFIITDDEGNIVIYQYQPEVPESQGGKHLVQRCDINTGARVNCLFRIKCKPSISPMLSREIQVAVTERRHATYFATLDGGLGYVIPLPEKTYRRFSMLQAKLVTGLPHAAGLNPKGFRMFHAPRQTIAYPQRNLLDGELLWRYPLLSNKERFDFAKQIGTAQNQILDDLMDIERNTAHL